MLCAEMRGDEQLWRGLPKLDDGERGGWVEVMPTALAIAVAQRFGQEDLRLLTVFVRRFLERDQHREFSAADVEAVLRGVLGEQLLLASVDPGLAIEIMYALLFALVDELELSDEQADGLLAAAEQQMAAADREIGPPPEGPPDLPVLADRMHRRTRQRYLSADDGATPATKNPAESAPGGLGRLFGGSRAKQSGRRGSAAATGKPASLAGRFLSATMLRHSDERRRLSAIVHELGNDDVTRLSRVAFTVAVRRHFSPDVHLRDIADLAATTRDSSTRS